MPMKTKEIIATAGAYILVAVMCIAAALWSIGGHSDSNDPDYFAAAPTGNDITVTPTGTVEIIDLENTEPSEDAPDGKITEDMATDAALDYLGYHITDVKGLTCALDESDGSARYIVSFYAGGYDYQVTVGAYSPAVTDCQQIARPDIYRNSGDDVRFFRFDGEQPFFSMEVDINGCQEGCLYRYDVETQAVTFLTGPVSDLGGYGAGYDVTDDHIYYCYADQPGKLYRADHDGGNEILMCEVSGEINAVQYFGQNDTGVIYILLNNHFVMCHDLTTKDTQVVMEQYYIDSFLYDGPNGYQTEYTPEIWWHGFLNQEDMDAAAEIGYFNDYIYDPATGENRENDYL